MRFGCWNVRSLVERDSRIETAAVSGRVVEDRKIHRVVSELQRLKIGATGLQEAHWFGCDSYVVDGFMVLSAGRPPPRDECSRRRCEGVAMVLDRDAADAWKNGGSIWTLVSSRVASCRLQFELADGSA